MFHFFNEMLGNLLKSQINVRDKSLQLIKQTRHRQPLWASTLHFISIHHLGLLDFSVLVTLVFFKVPLYLFFTWVRMSCKMRGLGCQSAYVSRLGLITASECSVITRVCNKGRALGKMRKTQELDCFMGQ